MKKAFLLATVAFMIATPTLALVSPEPRPDCAPIAVLGKAGNVLYYNFTSECAPEDSTEGEDNADEVVEEVTETETPAK